MKCVVLALGIFVCLVSAVRAGEVNLPADKDTWVDENLPSQNLGALDLFALWFDWGNPPPHPSIPLIMFDLPFEVIGAVVDEATLKLYVVLGDYYPGDVDIYRAADEWGELDVTWNNKPSENREITVTEALPSEPNNWFEPNVTSIVQAWADGELNHGFYLGVPDRGEEVHANFASKEHGDGEIHPMLYVRYHSDDVSEEQARPGLELHVSPNPSTGPVQLWFELSSSTPAALRIYDASGRLVETLMNGSVNAGDHTFTWDGAPGVYFLQLVTPARTLTEKLVLIH